MDDSQNTGHKWVDYIIPEGKTISKVETLLSKSDGWLRGFKWIGDDGGVLVSVGKIDNSIARNHPDCVVTYLTLNHNQRIVGVNSYSVGMKKAVHNLF